MRIQVMLMMLVSTSHSSEYTTLIFSSLVVVDEGQLLELSDPLDPRDVVDYDQGLHNVLHPIPTSG